jgi:hypothetical protein
MGAVVSSIRLVASKEPLQTFKASFLRTILFGSIVIVLLHATATRIGLSLAESASDDSAACLRGYCRFEHLFWLMAVLISLPISVLAVRRESQVAAILVPPFFSSHVTPTVLHRLPRKDPPLPHRLPHRSLRPFNVRRNLHWSRPLLFLRIHFQRPHFFFHRRETCREVAAEGAWQGGGGGGFLTPQMRCQRMRRR